MKKIIFVTTFFLLVFNLESATPQSISINFNGDNILFGCTSEVFLSTFFDYQQCVEENQYERINVYCKIIDNSNGNSFKFNSYFKFYNDKLFEMYIDEYFASQEYLDAIRDLKKQFKVVKEENDDESGSFELELIKGNLEGICSGWGEGTRFLCYDADILKEVKEQYPDYGNKQFE